MKEMKRILALVIAAVLCVSLAACSQESTRTGGIDPTPSAQTGTEPQTEPADNAGGGATVIDLPKIGLIGNSHFLFQELNNK